MVKVSVRTRTGERKECVIDDADLPAVASHSWFEKNGYAVTKVYAGKRNGHSIQRQVSMHRMLLGLPSDDPRVSDHVNRDRMDNRRANLRIVSASENAQNKSAYVRERRAAERSCAHRGVHWDKTAAKWKACARLHGKLHSLGYFTNAEDGAAAASDWRRRNMPCAVEGGARGQISLAGRVF